MCWCTHGVQTRIHGAGNVDKLLKGSEVEMLDETKKMKKEVLPPTSCPYFASVLQSL